MAVNIPFPLPATGYALNSKVRVNLDFLVAQFNEFNSGTATWDQVSIGTPNDLTGTLTFYNEFNPNYLTFKPGATGANLTFTLPTAYPSGQGLWRTTNAGIMDFVEGTGLLYEASGTVAFSGAAAQARSLVMLGTGGVPVLADHQYNVTAASNGLLYIPSGVEVKPLANGTGTNAILRGSSAGTPAYVTLLGTSNQVVVTHNGSDTTLSTPQDIGTGSSVIFNRVRAAAGSYASPGFHFESSTANIVGFYSETNGTGLNLRVGGSGGSAVAAWDSTGALFITGEFRAPTIRTLGTLQVSTSSGIVTIQSTGATSYTLTLPPDDGTSGYVLRTDGNGVLTWVSVAAAGGATTALDNLASVAINTTLVSDTDNTDDLGTTSINWRSLYIATSIKNGSTTLATATELGYLTGVTSAIQTQFSGKASTALSNLASVAINTTLVSDANNTDDLGTSSVRWRTGYLATSLDISATSNQFVLGTTRTVTITAPTPATSSRTHTIPDISGNGTFAFINAAQTWSSIQTFVDGTEVVGNQSSDVDFRLANQSSNSAAGARLQITAEDGGYDPRVSFILGGGGADFVFGIDNSDNDTLKIGQDASELSTNTFFSITVAGQVALGNGTGAVNVRLNSAATTGALTGTLTNSPVTGNPATWIQVNINGTNRYIPCW